MEKRTHAGSGFQRILYVLAGAKPGVISIVNAAVFSSNYNIAFQSNSNTMVHLYCASAVAIATKNLTFIDLLRNCNTDFNDQLQPEKNRING